MALTIKNPYPTDKPQSDYVPAISGSFSATKDFTGFIPGQRYTLVISGYNGHTTRPEIKDNGEWGPALVSDPATAFWNDEIVMPTNVLRIAVTGGTGELHFSAQLIKN